MTPTLLDVDGAALKVVSYLAAKDVLHLHAASRYWHSFLGAQEERIFQEFLLRDFPAEGPLLVHYVAKTKGVPFRKLYLSFHKRHILKLPRDFDLDTSDNSEERVCVPWTRPDWREYFRAPDLKWLQNEREKDRMGFRDYRHRVVNLLRGYPRIQEVLEESIGGSGRTPGGRNQFSQDDGKGEGGIGKRASSLDSIVKFDDSSQIAEEFGLVFIGRMGNFDDSWTSLPLKMEGHWSDTQALVADREAMMQVPELVDFYIPDDVGTIDLELSERMLGLLQNARGYDGWDEEFSDAFREEYQLTLHVVDVQTCQVLTLPIECDKIVVYLTEGERTMLVPEYDSLEVYGTPPRYSPKYKSLCFNQQDFRRCLDHRSYRYDYDAPALDQLSLRGNIHTLFVYDNESDGEPYMLANLGLGNKPFFYLGGEFSDVQRPEAVCSLLRSLMKEKCSEGEICAFSGSAGVRMQQQPSWVQSDTIVDDITKYASLEDQAGELRRVCRQFNSSALRQLEQKLDKEMPVGFSSNTRIDRYGNHRWFKASVRRGWSEDCLTDKKSVVNDALWLASCRCMSYYDKKGKCVGSCCDKKGSCPTAFEPPKLGGENEKSSTLDMGWARHQLAMNGWIDLPCPNSRIEAFYEEKDLNIYQLCNEVEEILRKGSRDGFDELESDLDYDVHGAVESKQLLRSMFLMFDNSKAEVEASVEGEELKRLRLSRNDTVRVGSVKTQIAGPHNATHSRMKKIYRFYSAANEGIEISIESRVTNVGTLPRRRGLGHEFNWATERWY